jgi:hypothetical protein
MPTASIAPPPDTTRPREPMTDEGNLLTSPPRARQLLRRVPQRPRAAACHSSISNRSPHSFGGVKVVDDVKRLGAGRAGRPDLGRLPAFVARAAGA